MKELNININFTPKEAKELKRFYNTTPVEFNDFLQMIIKESFLEMFHEAKEERKRKNHYEGFTLNDETDLQFQQIYQHWEKIHKNPLNMDSVMSSFIKKEYKRYKTVYEKEEIKWF